MLESGKIHQCKSPKRVTLFSLKKELRELIDNGALNKIFEANNSPIFRMDEMFGRLKEVRYFS